MDFGFFSPTHGPQLGPSQPLSLILIMLIVKREVTNISISSPAHQRLLIPTQFHLCSAMTSCVTPSDIVRAGLHQPQMFPFYSFLRIIGVPTHPRICNYKAFKSERFFKSLPGDLAMPTFLTTFLASFLTENVKFSFTRLTHTHRLFLTLPTWHTHGMR